MQRRRLDTATLCVASAVVSCSLHLEQRDEAAFRRAGYNLEFFERHNPSFRTGAAIHFAHAKQHDVLALTPLSDAAREDAEFDAECLEWLFNPPRMEPKMAYYGPHVGQAAWRLYFAIDWTHIHHEQTYDILSDKRIAWKDKARVTREAVEYYLAKSDVARSPAPLEFTMRRAAVMMKPYFGTYRNNYPRSATFFYFAHWWHPVIYEAMMIAGNDFEQAAAVDRIQAMIPEVVRDRPQRMLLSREIMPRYSRMSPESANIFDNLHMLHGFAYAILAYDGWSIDEQRAELYRVVNAMSEQPGDRELAALFDIPHPEMSPLWYEPWMKRYEGSMNDMMEAMLHGMWPMMSPDGSSEVPREVMDQLRLKLTPGIQPHEQPGSLHDALMQLVPNMKMDHEGMKPGATPRMAAMMTETWRRQAREKTPVRPMPMDQEPSLASPQMNDAPPAAATATQPGPAAATSRPHSSRRVPGAASAKPPPDAHERSGTSGRQRVRAPGKSAVQGEPS